MGIVCAHMYVGLQSKTDETMRMRNSIQIENEIIS